VLTSLQSAPAATSPLHQTDKRKKEQKLGHGHTSPLLAQFARISAPQTQLGLAVFNSKQSGLLRRTDDPAKRALYFCLSLTKVG